MPMARLRLWRDWRAPLALGCALVSANCATRIKPESAQPQTRVMFSTRIAAGTPRYEEKEDEVSNNPLPTEHPAPVYPAAAIALGLHRVNVSAKVIVDSEGKVGEVRIAPPFDPVAHPAVFDEAVREALLRWRYTPLTFTRWQEVKDTEGNIVDSREVSAERRPFSVDYDFVFELRDGKPVVGEATTRK